MSLTAAAIPLYSNAPSREVRVGEDSENLPDLRIELASGRPFRAPGKYYFFLCSSTFGNNNEYYAYPAESGSVTLIALPQCTAFNRPPAASTTRTAKAFWPPPHPKIARTRLLIGEPIAEPLKVLGPPRISINLSQGDKHYEYYCTQSPTLINASINAQKSDTLPGCRLSLE